MFEAPNLGRLEQVDVRTVWETEDRAFTPWLATEDNIALLGDTIGIELELEAQEKHVGPFRADILCKDTATDHWVLIENQLEKTDHVHLGQLMTYAAGLHAVTIVWIADKFTDEHRAALDWLNEITNDEFNFFGLEVEIWRIGDSAMAPKFNVISKPNDWARTISNAASRLENQELSDTRQLQLDYWQAFSELMKQRGGRVRPVKPRAAHWISYSVGRSRFRLSTFANTQHKRIGIGLLLAGPDAKAHFHLLKQEAAEIEKEIGDSLWWREMPDKKQSRIILRRPDYDPTQRDQWPEQHAWMYEKLEAFYRAFSERIKRLNADDYQPEDEDDAE